MKPSLGRIVLVRTKAEFNGSHTHPAIITRVWCDELIDVTIFPVGHPPHCASSVPLYQNDPGLTDELNAAFWPPLP